MPLKQVAKKFDPKKFLIAFIFILIVANVLIYGLVTRSFLRRAQGAGKTLDKYESKKEAQKIVYDCQNTQNRETCYSESFKKLTEKTDMIFAQKALAVVQDIDPKFALGCHLIAHYITIAETRKDPNKWKELLKKTDSNSCTGGYVHGILEAHMSANPDYKITATQIPIICSYLPDALAGGDVNCSHNLGHILLAQELDDITNSVKICNGVESYQMKYECLSGIFMERMTRLNLEAHGISKRVPWNKKNTAEMEKICREHSGVEGLTCWREISHMFATLNNSEPQGTHDECYRAPLEEYGKDCYFHATSIMAVSYDFKSENLIQVCSFYNSNPSLYNECTRYLIGGMLMSSVKYSDQVLRYCSNSPDEYKAACFGVMGNILHGATKSFAEKVNICNKVPALYQNNCLKGIPQESYVQQ